ncbi:conserved hypothetical protein [Aliivibrio fischeri MJ11]|uniref:Uncharacterized protein n=1 Tax=Aliivibrio fischeri (strain MJ11) TaxID=388396 RepID=B5EUD3_ALIFM|nr:hypothetical protein [Aliivibrio fischeri]ACH63470.1 conserved hypothetical protein [Aliivibrio fischeri MJ11]
MATLKIEIPGRVTIIHDCLIQENDFKKAMKPEKPTYFGGNPTYCLNQMSLDDFKNKVKTFTGTDYWMS